MASKASTRSMRSSSVFSLGYGINDCVIIQRHEDSESVESCAVEKHYNLKELFKYVKGKPTLENNEQACRSYLNRILGASYEYKVNQSIENLNNLPPLVCSTNQRPPDVQILQNSQILTVIEVHSGNYESTIEKGIMAVVELLRVKRSFTETCSSCTGFAFPKQPDKESFDQCVVKITVTWTGLKFMYTLASIANISDVKAAVVEVCKTAYLDTFTGEQQKEYAMALSTSELEKKFGSGAIQMASQSSSLIYLRDEGMWYKHPHRGSSIYSELISSVKEEGLPSCIINFNIHKMEGLGFVRYKTVKYDPLTIEEARLCLLDFVRKLALELQKYHTFGYSHQDIRLENVCFNEGYQPVLIDLDRSIDNHMSAVIHGKSCMYQSKKRPTQIDFMQLGWLATWVLDFSGDYHNRKFDQLPENLRSDLFITTLIKEGVYNDEHLKKSTILNHYQLLETVIRKRTQ